MTTPFRDKHDSDNFLSYKKLRARCAIGAEGGQGKSVELIAVCNGACKLQVS